MAWSCLQCGESNDDENSHCYSCKFKHEADAEAALQMRAQCFEELDVLFLLDRALVHAEQAVGVTQPREIGRAHV